MQTNIKYNSAKPVCKEDENKYTYDKESNINDCHYRICNFGGRCDDFYPGHGGNTLVVVTADHETGGFALSTDYQNNKDYNKLTPSFATGGHTASLVPVFAYGPGADLFNGVYLNSAIFSKMMKLLNAE